MRVILLTLFALTAAPAAAQMDELSPFDFEDEAGEGEGQAGEGQPLLEEFEVDARDAVLSAARTKTNIQEAPGIITVITADEMRARGHRTLNDVLRTVPGFEGDRLESNGWFNESIARGQPRTLLILLNGINITEPIRNTLSIDRKIPLDSVKRVEVTSGPGGVLWGSNALLGVVNVILKDQSDLDGAEFILGGGDGPGAQEAVKGRAAFGASWLDDDIRLYTAVDFYSDRGAELEVDVRKIIGALPEPELDSKTIYEARSGLTDFNSRDWWISHTLVLRLFETISLDWQLGLEQDHRQIATGGALLAGTRVEDGQIERVTVETEGRDPFQMAALGWRDRFVGDRLGISARLYGVRFDVDEKPFWAFPPRGDIGVEALEDGVSIGLDIDQALRYGLNIDADVDLGDHKIVFGFEGFQERLRDAFRQDTLRRLVYLPSLDTIVGPGNCPPAGVRSVNIDGKLTTANFLDDECHFEERFVQDIDRTVGAFYVSDEWRLARTLAIQPGYRLQLSGDYAAVNLFSAALVWNIVDRVFMKLNYAEGFRPPSYDSRYVVDTAVSTLSYRSNDQIRVEGSRAGEVELNAVLFENTGPLRRVYLRGDYAYTVLSDVIRNVGGQFANSGEREIHSAEFFARADFTGRHEIWLGGHFIRAEDSQFGPVRNFPNLAFTGGARARVIGPLELSGLAMWYGPQEDQNRPPGDETFPPGADTGFATADASDVVVERIDSTLTLRFGARLLALFDDHLDVEAFLDNALDVRRKDPDLFFDDRVNSRPQPRPGWSAFGQVRGRF